MGLFWLESNLVIKDKEGKLFSGTKQAARFNAYIHRVFGVDNIDEIMQFEGFCSEEFGTHSIRKGALTFTANVSTVGAGAHALRVRAGWSGVGVEGVYIQYEGASDQYVGRVASMLPLLSSGFIALPPRFLMETAEERVTLDKIIKKVWPKFDPRLKRLIMMVFASLVYSKRWIKRQIKKNNTLNSSSFFTNVTVAEHQWLKERVLGPFEHAEDASKRMTPTGIPPHVLNLITMDSIWKDISDLKRVFSQHVANKGNNGKAALSAECIQKLLEKAVNEVKDHVTEAVHSKKTSSLAFDEATVADSVDDDSDFEVQFTDTDKQTMIDADERQTESRQIVPTTSLQMWSSWHIGDATTGTKWQDLCFYNFEKNSTQRQYLRQVRMLAKFFDLVAEGEAKEKNDLTGCPPYNTLAELMEGYELIKDIVVKRETRKGTVRRIDQYRWTTAYKDWNGENKEERELLRARANLIYLKVLILVFQFST